MDFGPKRETNFEPEFAELSESNLARHHSRYSTRGGEEVILSRFLSDNIRLA
jgi:hypothetical protein